MFKSIEFVFAVVDIISKAKLLSDAGKYDSCGPKVCAADIQPGLGGVMHAQSEHKNCRMFKTLMKNSCSYDCAYCANRAGCTKRAAKYSPDELARLFVHLNTRHNINSLFLSSSVSRDPDESFSNMLDALRLLRNKHKFSGYIHCKVLPGTSYDLIKQASAFASRLSVNIEAPNKMILQELSSSKQFKSDILKRQAWISKMKLSAGQSTQVIVGNNTTDKQILSMMRWQYENLNLKRMYYSAFTPVAGTPLQRDSAVPTWREARLYNVDFLFRNYGFSFKELLSVLDEGMLSRQDPKLFLAREQFSGPLDVNEASYEELIRTPGIGPTSARRILMQKKVSSFVELHRLGVRLKVAKSFISVAGRRQARLSDF